MGAPRAVRGHFGRRRRRCVSVIVNLPNHSEAPRPQTSQCRFSDSEAQAEGPPGGPFNTSNIITANRYLLRGPERRQKTLVACARQRARASGGSGLDSRTKPGPGPLNLGVVVVVVGASFFLWRLLLWTLAVTFPVPYCPVSLHCISTGAGGFVLIFQVGTALLLARCPPFIRRRLRRPASKRAM